jgi:DNA-directed RNA polymerase specialized sigma24 family protein
MDQQEEIVRLLTIFLRRTSESQAEVVTELGRAGFGPTRIADLLGTSVGTVNVTLVRARRGRKKEV